MTEDAVKADLDQLLAAATAPSHVVAEPKLTPNPQLVRRFLRAHDVLPGKVTSIEVAALYRMYRDWSATLMGQPRMVRPLRFAAVLRDEGFKRRRPKKLSKTERDRKCLLVTREAAKRLLAWAKDHPLTPEDRNVFNPAARWSR